VVEADAVLTLQIRWMGVSLGRTSGISQKLREAAESLTTPITHPRQLTIYRRTRQLHRYTVALPPRRTGECGGAP